MGMLSDERFESWDDEEEFEIAEMEIPEEFEELLDTIDSIRVRYEDSLDDFDHEILNLLERIVECL